MRRGGARNEATSLDIKVSRAERGCRVPDRTFPTPRPSPDQDRLDRTAVMELAVGTPQAVVVTSMTSTTSTTGKRAPVRHHDLPCYESGTRVHVVIPYAHLRQVVIPGP